MERPVISRTMFHQCSAKGPTACKCAAGPVTTQTWQATVYAEPTGTDTKQFEASNYLLYFWLRAIPEALLHPYSVSEVSTVFPHSLLLLPLSSKMLILPTEWVPCQRMPELLPFATSYPFMHALAFIFRSLH